MNNIPQQTQANHTWKYPWHRTSRMDIKRHSWNGSEENQELRILRDKDLNNPAPFTHQTLISFDNFGALDFEKPLNFQDYYSDSMRSKKVKINVPIKQIIGLSITGNLDNYSEGMSFREVLFESLHGDGIIEESVEFLIGPESKDIDMPHRFNKNNPKSRSSGKLEISQYGDWFIVNNGKQRAIIAMYAIWQRYGDCGLLQNVTVTQYEKSYGID